MAEATEKKTRKRRTQEKIETAVPFPEEQSIAEEELPKEETLPEETSSEETAQPEQEEKNDAVLAALQEQNRILMQQVEALKTQLTNARPQVVQMAVDTEMIEFLWLAPVANDNELLIADGLYGKITGKTGNFSVPKREFSRVLDSATRKFLENRWLIILSGLTDNERRMYGVDYKPGEVLTKDIFMRLLDLGSDIIPIYKDLCEASKKVVAKLYYEAWLDPAQKRKVNRNTVVAMNKICSDPGWKAIIEEMNRAEAE